MMLVTGMFPFMIASILENSSTAASIRANMRIVTNAVFSIEEIV